MRYGHSGLIDQNILPFFAAAPYVGERIIFWRIVEGDFAQSALNDAADVTGKKC